MKKIAIYPGTFDPITLGHLDVIKTASVIFDEVIVALLINIQKKPMFTTVERHKLIHDTVDDSCLSNIKIINSDDSLTVQIARQEEAVAIVRGLRLTTEYETELNISFNNRMLDGKIHTILIPPLQEHVHISSSVVRELIRFGSVGDLDKYVPKVIIEHLKTKVTG